MPEAVHERIDAFQLRLYKLTTRSHLRIGAGEGSISLAAADNPVIQALFYTPPPTGEGSGEQDRVIYLPGSSLHGVVRAWSEKVQRSINGAYLERDALVAALDKLDENSKKAVRQSAEKEVRSYLGLSDDIVIDGDLLFEHWRVHSTVCDPLSLSDQCQHFDQNEGQSNKAKQDWLGQIGRKLPCPICQVYGYVGQRGRIRMQHAFPAKGGVPLDIITRVAINRISGAADEGKLFDVEAVPPGADFYFFVVLENMSEDHIKTFEYGLNAIEMQLATLGAHSTVGFGTVEVDEIMRADLEPTLFSQPHLPQQVKDAAKAGKLHSAASTLDAGRYPSFYRALASVDDNDAPLPIFQDHATISFGAG